MSWKAPLGYITVNTEEGTGIETDISDLREGILPDKSVGTGRPRIYSIKKGDNEKYMRINRFSYIDPNI